MKPLQPFKQMSNPVITLSERIANPTSIREMIGEDLFINEVQIAPWVIDEVKKLEEQVENLLDLSKTLLQNIEPDKFANGVGLSVVMITREMWDDFQKLITDIEGENQ